MHPQRSALRGLFDWAGKQELTTRSAVVAVAAGILAFAVLAATVSGGGTIPLDRELLLAMRHSSDLSPKGPIALQEAARDVTSLGGTVLLTLITAITAGFLALDGKSRMAGFVCISILTGSAASTLLKDLFHHARPDLVPHGMHVTNASFPSGHSMLSAITYLTLGALLARSHERRAVKVYFLLIAMFLTFVVGLTRVYLGVHWPTDVLAGWTAGGVWALLSWLVARRLQRRHTLEREAEHNP